MFTKVVSAEELGMPQKKLLWENPNPTTSFSNQDVYIEGLSEYKYIVIECIHHQSWYNTTNDKQPARFSTFLENFTESTATQYIFTGHANHPSTKEYHYRGVSRSKDTLSFVDASSGAYTIPVAIYGYPE